MQSTLQNIVCLISDFHLLFTPPNHSNDLQASVSSRACYNSAIFLHTSVAGTWYYVGFPSVMSTPHVILQRLAVRLLEPEMVRLFQG